MRLYEEIIIRQKVIRKTKKLRVGEIPNNWEKSLYGYGENNKDLEFIILKQE